VRHGLVTEPSPDSGMRYSVSSAFPGESGSLVRLQSRDACALDDACPAVHAQLIKQPL
jgi:hypothetical protein